MLRLASDENFNNRIVRGLQRRIKDLDLVRVQDTPLFSAPDEEVLEWAAEENRVLLTHDFATAIGYASDRVSVGLSMPGVIAASSGSPIGRIVEDLELLILGSEPGEFDSRIIYVPL